MEKTIFFFLNFFLPTSFSLVILEREREREGKREDLREKEIKREAISGKVFPSKNRRERII